MLTYPRLKLSSAMFMAKTQPKMQMLTTTKQLAIPFGIILQGVGQRTASLRLRDEHSDQDAQDAEDDVQPNWQDL